MLRTGESVEGKMRVKIVATLATFVALVTAFDPAFARHEADYNFPWVQTQSVRSPRTRHNESDHWGKHSDHGIFLEGSDYERSPAPRYD
jgi:hypothetical protein